jgi:hypothetical protein
MWHEALEEASRLYFGESNVEGMLAVLLPLHEMMEKQGPVTLKEIAFVQAYGRELSEAHEWLTKYRASRKEAELHQVRQPPQPAVWCAGVDGTGAVLLSRPPFAPRTHPPCRRVHLV